MQACLGQRFNGYKCQRNPSWFIPHKLILQGTASMNHNESNEYYDYRKYIISVDDCIMNHNKPQSGTI